MATNFVTKLPTPWTYCSVIPKRNGYRCLNIRINSVNDASILYENFVKFCPSTPELSELICERQVPHGQKLAHLVEYLRIYWTDFRNLCTI